MNEPKLLLAVSFGTSFADTREKTIGAIEKCIAKKYPQCTVHRCFTSRFIRKKLLERDGLHIDGPEEAIRNAREKGIRELAVQPLYLMHGFEHRRLMNLLKESDCFFDKISIGKPLLYDTSDFRVIADAIRRRIPVETEDTAVVLMGHGNENKNKSARRSINERPDTQHSNHSNEQPNPENSVWIPDGRELDIEDNAVFSVLQDALRSAGSDNYFIATVEGEPELEDILPQIKARGFKKVILAPFMVVAGDHARNDLAGDEEDSWKSIFLKNGFEVETIVRGIGEWEEVQELFSQHAGQCLQGS